VTLDDLPSLITEQRNPATAEIDRLPTPEMVRLMNAEDAKVAPAVAQALPQIAQAIDAMAPRLQAGGRLIYIGAGTSGRLGALDAVECLPTFGTPPDVLGIIVGGERALAHSVEASEDDPDQGRRDLAALNVTAGDSLVGISASGRTPYVVGALRYAREHSPLAVSVTCNTPSLLDDWVDIAINVPVGPEVLAGSTRLKAGTAQKMVLNMISTGVMIRLGKTFGNLMVDVQPTNSKLRIRARHIVQDACGLSPEQAAAILDECDGEVKTAIVAGLIGVPPTEARRRLMAAGGMIRQVLAA